MTTQLAGKTAVVTGASKGGSIINISSVVATFCPPGMGVYNATKGAVDSITRTFSRELAERKIRVNSVNPGLIATEGTTAVGFVKDETSTMPGVLVGQPDDIASVVTFLASPASRWINGEVHYVSGQLV
jgi:3-oxoacyl-[acyl-carrier protein] reductase